MHLTNSSIQTDYVAAGLPAFLAGSHHREPYGANKLSLDRLWRLLESEHGLQRSVLWPRIRAAVQAALFSVQDAIPSQVWRASRCLPRRCCVDLDPRPRPHAWSRGLRPPRARR